jgi:hypothetical protein
MTKRRRLRLLKSRHRRRDRPAVEIKANRSVDVGAVDAGPALTRRLSRGRPKELPDLTEIMANSGLADGSILIGQYSLLELGGALQNGNSDGRHDEHADKHLLKAGSEKLAAVED